jgi:hypothetical protein
MILLVVAACTDPFTGMRVSFGPPPPAVRLAEDGPNRLDAQCEPDHGQLLLLFELPGTGKCRADAKLKLGDFDVPELELKWRDATRGDGISTDHSLHVLGLTEAQEQALLAAETAWVSCGGHEATFVLEDVAGKLASCPAAPER